MFGGLDLKGGGGSERKKEAGDGADAAAPAPAAASGFSFMTSSTTSPPAVAPAEEEKSVPPAASSSGFSFMKSDDAREGIPSPAAAAAAAAAAGVTTTTTSAFSFMTASSPAPSKEEAPAPNTEPTVEASGATSSSFNFTQAGVTSAAEKPPTATIGSSMSAEAVDTVPPILESPPTSSFGFMAASAASDSATVSTISRDSPAPSLDPATDLLATTNSNTSAIQNQPVGSGVVFGGAAAKQNKPKKKRTRTAKIGAAAQQASLPPPSQPSRPATEATQSRQTSSANSSTLEAAAAATRRAEEFLHNKFKESSAEQQPIPSIQSVPSEEDDIVAAAKAAAEEAHKLEAAKQRSNSGGFGSLFRSRGRSPPATVTHHNVRPPIAMTTSSHSMSSREGGEQGAVVSAAERLQKEQTEAKRAMAERHLHMMQEQSKEVEEKDETPAEKQQHHHSSKPMVVVPVPAAPPSPAATPASPIRNFMAAKPKPATPAIIVDVMSAKPPKTATEKFHEMLDEFRTQVIASMEEVTRLRQHRAGLLEERFVTVAKELLAAQQKKQAEIHQMAAAESEDFELADQMSDTIRNHEREQAEYSAILENISRALAELEKQKALSVNQVTKCFQDIQEKLAAFQKEQESEDTKDATEALEKFSAISEQLSAENDRLQQDWKHLERDAELVAEERKELEKAISEQSGEYEKMRDQAKSKLTKVEEEIEELRQQLQAKQAIAAKLRTEAAGHEDAVLRVRVKFSRQLTRLQKKEMTIQDNQEEWELEKKSFERQREQHEAQVNQHSEALLSRDKLLDALNKEVEMADTFESIVAKEIGFDVSDELESDNELAQMQANVVKCEAAVSESKAALKAVTKVLNNLEEEIKTLEFQIPQFEEMKKAAAGRRDFKAAGKASKDIKEATARLADCKQQVASEAADRKAVAEKELRELEIELEKARKLAHEKQRESGVATMRRLADNIKRLVATKESVCGNSDDKTVQGVGAFVLNAQIKALKVEGQTYGDKYGGWDELMAEIGDGAEEDNAADATATAQAKLPSESNGEYKDESNVEQETAKSIEVPRDEPANDGKSAEERMCQFRELTKRLKQAEDDLEAAVAAEDFEKAAELDEVLQQLLADVQGLNMTDEEMELALAEPQDSAEVEARAFDHDRVKDAQDESSDEVTPGDCSEKVEKHVDKAIQEDEADGEPIRQTNDGDGPKEYCDQVNENGDESSPGSAKDDGANGAADAAAEVCRVETEDELSNDVVNGEADTLSAENGEK